MAGPTTAVDDCAVVLVTAPPDEAPALARTLVEESVCACVNIVPAVRSIYHWQGKVCDDAEALLVIKTRMSLVDQLTERVNAIHSYDVPEVICLPIAHGNPNYLEWIKTETESSR